MRDLIIDGWGHIGSTTTCGTTIAAVQSTEIATKASSHSVIVGLAVTLMGCLCNIHHFSWNILSRKPPLLIHNHPKL